MGPSPKMAPCIRRVAVQLKSDAMAEGAAAQLEKMSRLVTRAESISA